jgi:DNA-directed RNA polymerase subunit RPC12/RpoP
MSGNNSWRWLDDETDLPSIERINHRPHGARDSERAQDIPRRDRSSLENPAFRCTRCKAWVESDPEVAGVKHRNHCPYCLYSRHLDRDKPGDRRSDCRAAMRPVGLTLKASHNKYGSDDGELMLIHHCLGCGALSINRIAADDNAEQILAVFEASAALKQDLRVDLARQGIHPLNPGDLNLVLMRLFGKPGIDLAVKLTAVQERAKV